MSFPTMVETGLETARRKHPQSLITLHDGLGVILEEFEEFKAEVFKRHTSKEKLLSELISLAAMCQRMAEDVVFDLFEEGNVEKYEKCMVGHSKRAKPEF